MNIINEVGLIEILGKNNEIKKLKKENAFMKRKISFLISCINSGEQLVDNWEEVFNRNEGE